LTSGPPLLAVTVRELEQEPVWVRGLEQEPVPVLGRELHS